MRASRVRALFLLLMLCGYDKTTPSSVLLFSVSFPCQNCGSSTFAELYQVSSGLYSSAKALESKLHRMFALAALSPH